MDLPIAGSALAVSTASTVYQLALAAGPYDINIEGELAVHSPTGARLHRIPGEPHTDDLVAALTGVIVAATVADNGELRIDLASGHRLVVEPDPYFEAWNVTAPGRYLVVCMPGGELAVWSAET
ncbi:DUF6188 family protein [Nocardia seriolae]|uniref:Uncharacterized protein n=1 Tax=Nocardia seriolae TaxID=37332 RepID=A0A0B8N5A3_9NOCA|nr:DUF6188 family protein [Nocardia seriolae]MTJ62573.1 hypothetical protein [Nocardia seriolae]MTJ71999.1 hypothetical protein [Nocardia seriolae]MTJ87470.1 hypothetical protein [Nocardia seriolae]MTK31461.1 hypothetical protein [Nocardia seriolae]MTK42412.1 hypothetical protein [Nocardia seriolae]